MQSNVCVLVLDRVDSYSSHLLSITSSNISQGFKAARHKLALLYNKNVTWDTFLEHSVDKIYNILVGSPAVSIFLLDVCFQMFVMLVSIFTIN